MEPCNLVRLMSTPVTENPERRLGVRYKVFVIKAFPRSLRFSESDSFEIWQGHDGDRAAGIAHQGASSSQAGKFGGAQALWQIVGSTGDMRDGAAEGARAEEARAALALLSMVASSAPATVLDNLPTLLRVR